MTAPTPEQDEPGEGRSPKQHGDPLMASAQGRGDGTDASRQGADSDATDERD
jgi:hypothetical protein